MSQRRALLWILAGGVALLGLCGLLAGAWALGRERTTASTPPDAQVATWAAATLQALSLTPSADGSALGAATEPLPGSPTSPASLPASATVTPRPPTATAAPIPTPSPTPPCLAARFVEDVTVPDDTTFAPGEAFTKTWRLRNVGSCTWTTAFEAFFDEGDTLAAPPAVPLPQAVEPGETVDISVSMQAPATAGTYQGYWKLRSDRGQAFGIGDRHNDAFWVRIQVVASPTLPPPPPPMLDLYADAADAQWVSGAGVLPFDGADNDPRGFVKPRPGALLEDGSTPAQVLETHPEWVDDGGISGRYPPFTIVDGHHFQAQIGFLALADGGCGAGDVIFQVNYRDEGGTLHPLGQWHETCDGTLHFVDLDLSPLAGQQIQLVLAVMANGSSAQDWAVWVQPRVLVP